MEEAAHSLYSSIRDGCLAADPLERLVDGVCISEDVVGSLPIGVLIGSAEARDPECRRIGKCPAEVGRRGSGLRSGFERIDDRAGIVGKEVLGQERMIRPAAHGAGNCEQMEQFQSGLLAQGGKIDGLAPFRRTPQHPLMPPSGRQ